MWLDGNNLVIVAWERWRSPGGDGYSKAACKLLFRLGMRRMARYRPSMYKRLGECATFNRPRLAYQPTAWHIGCADRRRLRRASGIAKQTRPVAKLG